MFSILEFCPVDKLIEQEQYYIDTLHPEFNICPIAGSSLGVKHTEESKQKNRESRKTFYQTDAGKEKRQKMSKAMTGENNPMKRPEVRKKIGEVTKAFYQTSTGKEFKGKHSEAMVKYWVKKKSVFNKPNITCTERS